MVSLTEFFLFVLERDLEVFILTALINELNEVLQREKFKKYLKKSPLEFIYKCSSSIWKFY